MVDNMVNKDLPITLYYQIGEDIRNKIRAKQWKSGSRLPSEADICRMYNVSRITVRKALDELEQQGYIERIQGRGTFVCKKAMEQKLSKFYSFSNELLKKGVKEKTKLLAFEVIFAGNELADALKISPGQEVYKVDRVRYVDDSPYASEQSYIPKALAEGLSGEMVLINGLYRSLNLLGVFLDAAQESFSAINLPDEAAEILQVEPRTAAISLTRTTFSGLQVVEYCNSLVLGDFFSYTVELK